LRLSLHTLTVDGERLPEVQQFADLARDLRLHLAPEGSAINPFLVDNLYPRLASPALPIDLTQIDNIASSLSSLSGKSGPYHYAISPPSTFAHAFLL
jgi:hypothetical protein